MKEDSTHRALRNVQFTVREGQLDGSSPVATRRIPEEKRTVHTHMSFSSSEAAAVLNLAAALGSDPSYEHLDRPEDAAWDFAMDCALDRSSDHVQAFVQAHARQPETVRCFMPVERLTVTVPMHVGDMTLLPLNDAAIPDAIGRYSLDESVGCVAAVSVTGTSPTLMHERAATNAEHELRKLRATVKGGVLGLHRSQLLFRLGSSFAFSDLRHGWQTRSDSAFGLELTVAALKLASEEPILSLPFQPTSDVDRRAEVALRWIERAQLENDEVSSILFLFFALEALLGSRSERLKAQGLAFRRAMLDVVTDGTFRHPNSILLTYDKVRSHAVHGEGIPSVSADDLSTFTEDVKRATNRFLRFAHERGVAKRARVRRLLEEHEEAPILLEWLRKNGDSRWDDYSLPIADGISKPFSRKPR